MLISLSFLLVLSGAPGQTVGMQPSAGMQPHIRTAQPGPVLRTRVSHSSFGFGQQSARPAQTRGTSAPPPPPPTDLPLANLAPSLEGPDIQIAFKSGSILAIRSYRLEGDSVHYKNNFGGENTVPLSALNMERTQKLNADRHIQFGAR